METQAEKKPMPDAPSIEKHKVKIGRQILLAMLLVSVVPILGAAYLFQIKAEKVFYNNVVDNLNSVASRAEQSLRIIVEKNIEEINSALGNRQLALDLESYISTKSKAKDKNLRELLFTILGSDKDYKEVCIVDKNGLVLISTLVYSEGDAFSPKSLIDRGMEKVIFDYQGTYNEKGEVLLSGPIMMDSITIGILAIRSVPTTLKEIALDYTGLGKTGDILLAKRTAKGGANFLIKPRFSDLPNASTVIPRYLVNDAMTLALQGKEGVHFDMVDYRGQNVIAVTRYIKNLDWGLVTKFDYNEIFATLNQFKKDALQVLALTVSLVLLLSSILTGGIVKPIKYLSFVAQKIAEGSRGYRFDRGIARRSDELGSLAKSFELMTNNFIELNLELEQKVAERTAELELSNKDLEQFAYIASHDLKAPLRAVDNYASWVLEDSAESLSEESRQHLEKLRSRISGMFSMLDGLLRYARVSHANEKAVPVDTYKLVTDVVALLSPAPQMEVHIQKPMPVIVSAKAPLELVFRNLISNSIKFQGDEKGYVRIEGRELTDCYEFSVEDHGPGIPEQLHEKIFKIFNRAGSDKNVPGTGIGLSLVKKILERMSAEIKVASGEEKGTKFTFTWPKSQFEPTNENADEPDNSMAFKH